MKTNNLIGKSLTELEQLCLDSNFPKFHGGQLYKWIYNKSISTVDLMTDIPDLLKKIIKKNYSIDCLTIKKTQCSNIDNTTKYLLQTDDNNLIECVSMIDKNRHTVCVSSQIGCSVDCDFCATGKMGIIRNLEIGEIINQLTIIIRERKIPITNIVYMGMGEPFLNYNNVIKSCQIITHNKAFNLGTKRITISTSGILPKIERFIADKEKYKLAISLNASNNEVRDKLIPINKKWPIEKIISAVNKYHFHKYRPIMFEYILIKNINDTEEDAYRLTQLLKNVNCKINIIPYNPISANYERSDKEKILAFTSTLKNNKYNLRVFIRWSKGQDIDAGCGQLVTKHEN